MDDNVISVDFARNEISPNVIWLHDEMIEFMRVQIECGASEDEIAEAFNILMLEIMTGEQLI